MAILRVLPDTLQRIDRIARASFEARSATVRRALEIGLRRLEQKVRWWHGDCLNIGELDRLNRRLRPGLSDSAFRHVAQIAEASAQPLSATAAELIEEGLRMRQRAAVAPKLVSGPAPKPGVVEAAIDGIAKNMTLLEKYAAHLSGEQYGQLGDAIDLINDITGIVFLAPRSEAR